MFLFYLLFCYLLVIGTPVLAHIMLVEYDNLFKILIVGDAGVGKSSILLRYTDSVFTEEFISTIGCDFKVKSLDIGTKLIRLQIWDSAGQERFRQISNSYYRGAHAVLAVFDITEMNSYINLQKNWLSEITRNASEDVLLIIVGTKTDWEEKRRVSFEDANEFACSLNIPYFECSAKENTNIDTIFQFAASELVEKFVEKEEEQIFRIQPQPIKQEKFKSVTKTIKSVFKGTKKNIINTKKNLSTKKLVTIDNVVGEVTNNTNETGLTTSNSSLHIISTKLMDSFQKGIVVECKQFKAQLDAHCVYHMPNSPINNYGDTILHECARTHNMELIKYFQEWWFDKCSSDRVFLNLKPGLWRNNNLDTPLHVFCARLNGRDSDKLLQFIELPGTDIFTLNENQISAATVLADRGRPARKLLQCLLKYDVSNNKAWDWKNIIESAIESDIFSYIVKLLPRSIRKKYLNTNQSVDYDNKTPPFKGEKNMNHLSKEIISILNSSSTKDEDDIIIANLCEKFKLFEQYHETPLHVHDYLFIIPECVRTSNILRIKKLLETIEYFSNSVENTRLFLIKYMEIAISFGEFKSIHDFLEIYPNFMPTNRIVVGLIYYHNLHKQNLSCSCNSIFSTFLCNIKNNNKLIEPIGETANNNTILHEFISNDCDVEFLKILFNYLEKVDINVKDFILQKNGNDVSSLQMSTTNLKIFALVLSYFTGSESKEHSSIDFLFHTNKLNENLLHYTIDNAPNDNVCCDILKLIYQSFLKDKEESICKQLVSSQNSVLETPILIAVKQNFKNSVEVLLNVYKADPNIKDERGYSCIHVAAVKDDLQLLELIYQNTSSSILECNVNEKGVSPLHLVASYSSLNSKEKIQLFNNNIDNSIEGHNNLSLRVKDSHGEIILPLCSIYWY